MDAQVISKTKRSSDKRVRWFLRMVSAVALFLRDKVRQDFNLMVTQSRLFIGIAFLCVGFLLFESGKYCDGNPSNYYACTRPSTYYYYPWWAILLVILGSFSVVLWFLRKDK